MPKKKLAQQLGAMRYTETEELEELFASSSASAHAGVTLLPINSLVEYRDESFEKITGRPQPFCAYTEEDLKALAKSIAAHGVIDPVIVRPAASGKYQIIAGRNRTRASALCGKTEIPCIIRGDLDDEQAAMIMLDTNLEQRHNLTYSEKAYAYKMRLELQNRQGKRTDLENGAEKVDTLDEAGKQNQESRRTVAYLIRLTYLLPELLEAVDGGRIGFKTGVELSYLRPDTQRYILTAILPSGAALRQAQAAELRRLEKNGPLYPETIRQVITAKSQKPPSVSYTIRSSKLQEYADVIQNTADLERLFLEFLQTYRAKRSA